MANESKEAEVRAVTQRWLEATVRADADGLDELLEEGYTFTHATTAITDTREEWLDSFRSGRRRYTKWEISDVSVCLYPGAAVMIGRGHQEIPREDGLFDLRTSFMNTWIEHDGKWRLAAWQATLVPNS
jgi:ketosteroid isomerase-like protein